MSEEHGEKPKGSVISFLFENSAFLIAVKPVALAIIQNYLKGHPLKKTADCG